MFSVQPLVKIFSGFIRIQFEMIREMKIVLNDLNDFIRFLLCVCEKHLNLMDIPMMFMFISEDLSLFPFIKYKAMC